ncbi:hypothetical protein [Cellulomonas terrae]|uniref:MinD-like ATPase involved in chromosome partitioning or flagellar assembly n=1 Tax=Cellulomonas terrae TaxID=311234 RepID=A0A511JLX1_9CELL|nr:hypothetical protein [Cellulomonas terrae]GEL98889.1 hypothetical protein CTE05_24360 [Cellulomonas terrae]
MLVAFGSAKGSPGVTTTARVLASVWPGDVVLVDADPAGGDTSLLARTPDRGALDPERGLLSLAADARRGLVQGGVREHLQTIEGGLDVLCGVSTPEQMTGIANVWPALAAELAQVQATDVLVDCGRIVASSPVLPVVMAADVLVLVARPRLESFAHVRERVRWLAHLQDTTARVPAVGVVLVADSRDKRSLADLQQLLAHERLPATVLGQVALDERAADVVAGRLERPIARSLLVRSVRQLVEPVAALAVERGAVRRPA